MPSRDWDDSWYDDDEFPPVRSKHGRGGVVAAAVVTFIMCAFNALSASCLLFCGFMFTIAGPGGNGNPFQGPNQAVLLLAFGLASGVSFVAQIVAGIGLVNNKRWSRTLSFYLAGYSMLLSIYLIYLLVGAFRPQGMGGNEGEAIFGFAGLVFHGGYATTIFLLMLNARIASSLR